jgi:hypothetical protein
MKFCSPPDAYGKITRGHYRVVSLVPVPPAERFIPLEGVEPLEVGLDGTAWRWLQKEARLVVPRMGRSLTEFSFLLPPGAPHERAELLLFVDDQLRAGLRGPGNLSSAAADAEEAFHG